MSVRLDVNMCVALKCVLVFVCDLTLKCVTVCWCGLESTGVCNVAGVCVHAGWHVC